ncbi:hypothetical protein CPC735_011950 [Coccidioides posadasii C735 delta SOWgp]|uniref:Uncharacterized protein n=1 Tax=Coccidioides posadasii (strain C735) TaxID=222929 RepID=C5NZI4_COCP7|nr:hypothetical protein CPC735_011950 [Coccidioides posadasii C735 delta SOWgp]EER29877.1 hypothetical protein CPC735_011950 [Coccidioides posadasii C735 delta SOWgp]|eukprot:XP_003072022.1 hypothetical protein CPC735_011950 [Coccidioides posadasii C735 delta SOWgp]
MIPGRVSGKTNLLFQRAQSMRSVLSVADVVDLVFSNAVSAHTLCSLIRHLQETILASTHRGLDSYYQLFKSLRALGLTDKYRMVPSATLAIRSICAPLYKARWIPPMAGLSANASHDLDRPRTFACIAMFESGHLNLDPYLLNEVFPMPSVDSLFISGSILCDPSEVPDQFEVHRVVGNVGRAGIALLIPPQAPQIKAVDIGSWNLLSHDKFDGEIIDSFPGTSMHLAFSGYKLPLQTGANDMQDVDAYLLESIVQVRDKGKWVADVDILKAVKPRRNLSRVGRYRSNDRCDHCVSPTTIDIPMTSIDTWEELLEGPERLAVARAHGN